jgi:hypothetical protein
MEQLLNSSSAALRWRREKPIFSSCIIDLCGEGENILCLLELELRREDPVNNVIKIWRAIENDPHTYSQGHLVILHAFSEFYQSHKSKMENAVFAGQKMVHAIHRLSYKPLMFDLLPPVAREPFPTNTDGQLQRICADVVAHVDQQLKGK